MIRSFLVKPVPQKGNTPDYQCTSKMRNGIVNTIGIELMTTGSDTVMLTPITSKRQPASGWIEMSPEAMDEMCKFWIEFRTKGTAENG